MIHHRLCPVCGFDSEYTHNCDVVLRRKEDFLKAKIGDSDLAKKNAEAAKRLKALEQAIGELTFLPAIYMRADEIMREEGE